MKENPIHVQESRGKMSTWHASLLSPPGWCCLLDWKVPVFCHSYLKRGLFIVIGVASVGLS